MKKSILVATFIALFTNMFWAQDIFSVEYNKNNSVTEIGKISNKQKEGLYAYFDGKGFVRKFSFYKEGEKQKFSKVVLEKEYYDNEVLKSIGVLKENKKEGVWFFFSVHGFINSAQNFSNGLLDNTSYRFQPDGELASYTNYVNGKMDGEYKEFHYGGDLHVEAIYKDDKIIDGDLIYYHPNGNIKTSYTYLNNKVIGKSRTYYLSGQIEIDGQYNENGYKTGVWKEYYENGVLKEQYTCKNGGFHGEFIKYKKDGSIDKIYIFEKNKLIENKTNDD
ncbi:hypothetical protein [uncultured Winogradskyella sp.]|uniref:toxin-antitoxin system YwqK family antitoxin n=1 Tax=uncultured Winogradskyella sp. TaxID=395353 RepID=UPI002634ED1D|nr:hypothetical protein [uncultured Winogradskyella sp.]